MRKPYAQRRRETWSRPCDFLEILESFRKGAALPLKGDPHWEDRIELMTRRPPASPEPQRAGDKAEGRYDATPSGAPRPRRSGSGSPCAMNCMETEFMQ